MYRREGPDTIPMIQFDENNLSNNVYIYMCKGRTYAKQTLSYIVMFSFLCTSLLTLFFILHHHVYYKPYPILLPLPSVRECYYINSLNSFQWLINACSYGCSVIEILQRSSMYNVGESVHRTLYPNYLFGNQCRLTCVGLVDNIAELTVNQRRISFINTSTNFRIENHAHTGQIYVISRHVQQV